jgi:hypothetical protein
MDLHSLQFTTEQNLFFAFSYVFTTSLVTASNCRRSPSPRFSNCLRASPSAILFYSIQEGSLFTHWTEVSFSQNVKIILQPTVDQSICPSETRYQFFLSFSLNYFRQLRVCYYDAPSTMRGRICNSRLLLGFSSAVFLRSEFRGGLVTKFYCSKVETRPTCRVKFV